MTKLDEDAMKRAARAGVTDKPSHGFKAPDASGSATTL